LVKVLVENPYLKALAVTRFISLLKAAKLAPGAVESSGSYLPDALLFYLG